MAEALNAEEFAHFKDHLRAQRDAVSDGGTKEPGPELLHILSMQQMILLAPDITGAADLLNLNAVVLSETARALGMNEPYIAVRRTTY